jgi:hypothetical protein
MRENREKKKKKKTSSLNAPSSFRWMVELISTLATSERWELAQWQACLRDLQVMTAKGGVWEHQDFALAARRYLQRKISRLTQSA